MKEEECARLKQILYTKEEVIRKISVAYEQSKTDEEAFQDRVEVYKSQIKALQKASPENLIKENLSLKEQNKELIVTLIDHLCQSKSRSRKRSKRKKSRFSGTLVNLKKSAGEHSRRRLSKKKKVNRGRMASNKRLYKDRGNLSNLKRMNQFSEFSEASK